MSARPLAGGGTTTVRPLFIAPLGAFLCALFTALVWLVQGFDVAYRSPQMHVAVEIAGATTSAVVAYLLLGRFRRGGRSNDLLLAAAFGVLVVENAFLLALPTLLSYGHMTLFSTWTSTATTVLVSGLLAAGAVDKARVLVRTRRAALAASVAVALVLATITEVVLHFRSSLPRGLDPLLSPVSKETALLAGHPAVLATQAASSVLLAIASVGFLRREEFKGDPLLSWLGWGLLINGFAALNYVLFPSLYSDWVYSGDILRFVFYLALLVATASEVRAYALRIVETAVLEERRRIARDFHDGVAQELAFIATQLRDLVPQAERFTLGSVASAAERALFESRRALAALTQPLDQPLEIGIAQTAEDVVNRVVGPTLRLELARDVQAPLEQREAILRLVREATTNAVRHGRASTVSVTLTCQEALVLRVRDDGVGFDPAAAAGFGFGLQGMAERVERLGGHFQLQSSPGVGTMIEAVFPSRAWSTSMRGGFRTGWRRLR